MFSEQELKFYDRYGKTRPEQHKHGTDSLESPISDQLERLKPSNWRMEGNKLIADTQHGPLVQYISSDYICKGTDSKGLPILEKIAVS